MRKAAVRKPKKEAPSDLQDGVEDVMRSVLEDWRRDKQLFTMMDKLRIIQYFGTYLNRRYGWDYKYDDTGTSGGTSLHKYTGAFKTNAVSGGKTGAGQSAAPTGPRLVFDDDDGDGDSIEDAIE